MPSTSAPIRPAPTSIVSLRNLHSRAGSVALAADAAWLRQPTRLEENPVDDRGVPAVSDAYRMATLSGLWDGGKP